MAIRSSKRWNQNFPVTFCKRQKRGSKNAAVGMDDTPKVAPMRVESIPWDIETANYHLQNQLIKPDEIAIRDARAIFEA